MTAVLPSALDAFVADATVICSSPEDVRVRVRMLKRRLADLVTCGAWLPAHAHEGDPDRYRQHILYVAPDRSFSVVALVWQPGQVTPIHDHVSWCIVGVYEGEESQTKYQLAHDAAGEYLVETASEVARTGDCSSLIPPEENIHRVRNAGPGRAISIHVYGADIEALGTSINRTFDHLPVRTGLGDGRPQGWRQP